MCIGLLVDVCSGHLVLAIRLGSQYGETAGLHKDDVEQIKVVFMKNVLRITLPMQEEEMKQEFLLYGPR